MTRLERYVERYGPVAGPRLYHTLQSRSAYIGATHRLRRIISDLNGGPARPRRTTRNAGDDRPTPLFPEPVEAVDEALTPA